MKEKIIIWGTGKIAKSLVHKEFLYDKFDVLSFVDNNKESWGKKFEGKKVISPSEIGNYYYRNGEYSFDKLIVAIGDYSSVIEQIKTDYQDLSKITETYHYIFRKQLHNKYINNTDPEIQKVIEWTRNNELFFLPYDFAIEYFKRDVDAYYDAKHSLYYVNYRGRKMYFAKHINTLEKAKNYYKGLLAEQDECSPHRYLIDDINVAEGDVVVDCGAAEGNFSLDIIDIAKKIYLIEYDESWIEALQLTFRDYRDKVEIIKGKISSYSLGNYITLDDVIKEPVNFIKMDIEGSEWDGLIGAKRLISQSPNIRCAICSYHRPFDEILIKDELEKYDIKTYSSNGYVWFSGIDYLQEWRSDCLRRCIVYGIKNG